MKSLLAALALCLGLSASSTAQTPAISFGQPTIEGPTQVFITVTGTPGSPAWWLVDFDPGPVFIPKYGELNVGLTNNLLVLYLGVLPASGSITFPCDIPCLNDFLPGAESLPIWSEIVVKTPQGFETAEETRVDMVAGDCSDECEKGIRALGVETTLTNVTSTVGTLTLEMREKKADGKLQASFSAVVDLSQDGDLPLSNDEGSLTVLMLDHDGDTLVVRLEAFAPAAAELDAVKLKSNTYFSVDFEGSSSAGVIHTSCSLDIAVGSVFPPFTVTNLIDGKDENDGN